MSSFRHPGPIELWQRRILGGFWALCGIFLLVYTFRSFGWIDEWSDRRPWIAAPIGALYLGSGVGFILGPLWARTMMAVITTFTGVFLMFLAAGAHWIG